jgi:hypothetical protein
VDPLKPIRTEEAAFRFLLYVAGAFVVLIALVLIARAIF